MRQLFDVTMVEYNAKADLVEAAQMYKNCAVSVSGEVAPRSPRGRGTGRQRPADHPERGCQLRGRAGRERCEYFGPQSGEL